MGRLILAEEDTTVHIKVGEKVELPDGTFYEPHESKVLLAGQTINSDEITGYLFDLVKQGKAAGLALRTQAQVNKLLRESAIAKGEINPESEEVKETSEVE
jgi:hypothetical protein